MILHSDEQAQYTIIFRHSRMKFEYAMDPILRPYIYMLYIIVVHLSLCFRLTCYTLFQLQGNA